MSDQSGSFSGWNIDDVKSRCLDIDLCRLLDATRAAWVAAGARTRKPTIHSFWEDPQREQSEVDGYARYEEFKNASREVDIAFRRLMMEGRLFGWGRIGKSTTDSKPIPPASWKYLKLVKDPTCVIDTDKSHIVDLRIYPFAHDPEVARKLFGKTLQQAFRVCVLDDPEVQSCGHRVVAKHGYAHFFEKGEWPRGGITYNWPVDLKAHDLAYDFNKPSAYSIDQRFPPPSSEIEQAAIVIEDRMRAFRRLLTNGECVARGTVVKTGVVQPISPRHWERNSVWINIENGDVLERTGHELETQWSGVELVIPEQSTGPSFSAVSRLIVEIPEPKGESQASIAQAIAAEYPDGMPRGLPRVRRDETIREMQRKLGLRVTSDSTIKRYLD